MASFGDDDKDRLSNWPPKLLTTCIPDLDAFQSGAGGTYSSTPYRRLKLARTRKETAAATPQHRDAPAEAPRQSGWGAEVY